jgi:hypothetical protein
MRLIWSQLTKRHVQREPLADLTSEEIIENLKAIGWGFRSDKTLDSEG